MNRPNRNRNEHIPQNVLNSLQDICNGASQRIRRGDFKVLIGTVTAFGCGYLAYKLYQRYDPEFVFTKDDIKDIIIIPLGAILNEIRASHAKPLPQRRASDQHENSVSYPANPPSLESGDRSPEENGNSRGPQSSGLRPEVQRLDQPSSDHQIGIYNQPSYSQEGYQRVEPQPPAPAQPQPPRQSTPRQKICTGDNFTNVKGIITKTTTNGVTNISTASDADITTGDTYKDIGESAKITKTQTNCSTIVDGQMQ